mgnify:CR=1 FL=1
MMAGYCPFPPRSPCRPPIIRASRSPGKYLPSISGARCPGTGLGVAALVFKNGRAQVLPSEGGRCDFAPLDAVEDRILQNLRAKHGQVSVERVVAGPGLRAIFEVLCEMEGRAMPPGDDKALWSLALAGKNSIAIAALDRFFQALGAVVGDISLTHGPGPVVLAGGLGLRLAKHISGLLGAATAFAAEYPD